jgi:lipopolysaccharide biosynthesis glycosyltransferase
MQQEKVAICTLCIGKESDEFAQYSHPIMKLYAQKIGADFVVIDMPKINFKKAKKFRNILFEKYQLYDILETYSRALFLDTDILITPHAPNVFNYVPKDSIGGVFEDFGSTEAHRRKLIREVQNALGDVNWKEGFINSGVFVVSACHREVFRYYEKYGFYDGEYEQTNTNWYFRKSGYPIFPMDYRYNFQGIMRIYYGPEHRQAYFIHYAGNGIITDKPRIEQMKADYLYFYDREKYSPKEDILDEGII